MLNGKKNLKRLLMALLNFYNVLQVKKLEGDRQDNGVGAGRGFDYRKVIERFYTLIVVMDTLIYTCENIP